MLSHLIYVSARAPKCTETEIDKILKACQKNNGPANVTGVLLYSDTQFVQYLEGEYKEIIGLYDKIKTDDRHKNAILISSSPINERSFPSWQMGSRKLAGDAVSFKGEMPAEDVAVFNNILAGKNQESMRAVSVIKRFFK